MNQVSAYTGRMRWYPGRGPFACILVAMTLQFTGCSGPPLQPWHTEKLTAEFTAKEWIRTFDDYRQLEDKLFAQLEEQVYAHWNRTCLCARPLQRRQCGRPATPQPQLEPQLRAVNRFTCRRSPVVARNVGFSIQLSGPGCGAQPAQLLGHWSPLARSRNRAIGAIERHMGGHGRRSAVGHGAPRIQSGQETDPHRGLFNGAPLALNFTLDALEGSAAPVPASLVLISPAIGLHPAARLAGLMDGLSVVPGLARLAWLSIEPEFDPYKYNSFATNAGTQVDRLTRGVSRRIADRGRSGPIISFPPTLVFKYRRRCNGFGRRRG